MSSDPALMSATELLRRYREKSLSPVEVTQACFARIERHDPTLNAFCVKDLEGAMAAARASEARWAAAAPQGLVDGVPTTVKDVVTMKGFVTKRGSRTLDDAPPDSEDAPATARLREAGAVILGKTTTPEFGWKGVTDSPLTGITRNPWNTERTPGGSSGGAAAAAASGMGALHIGTDGGGSIRIPSGFTGIFGHKPSFGRVPAFPLSPFGTIAHLGPMTRTVEDAALMLTVMAKRDHRDPYGLPDLGQDYSDGLADGIEGLRIAFSPTMGGHHVEPDVAAKVAEAVKRFEELGATVEEADPGLQACGATFEVLWFSGAAKVFHGLTPAQQELVDPGFRRIAEIGSRYTLFNYLDAQKHREQLMGKMQAFHETYDLLLTPSLPLTAFGAGLEFPSRHGEHAWIDWTPFSYPFNLTQQPACSIPCGFADDGLPVGLQIVGRRYDDRTVLRAARAFESVMPIVLPSLD